MNTEIKFKKFCCDITGCPFTIDMILGLIAEAIRNKIDEVYSYKIAVSSTDIVKFPAGQNTLYSATVFVDFFLLPTVEEIEIIMLKKSIKHLKVEAITGGYHFYAIMPVKFILPLI